jgi:hypothetical protein
VIENLRLTEKQIAEEAERRAEAYCLDHPMSHLEFMQQVEIFKAEIRKDAAAFLSLRDHFAGQAMAAHISAHPGSMNHSSQPAVVAEWAYAQADAMLAEREKGGHE